MKHLIIGIMLLSVIGCATTAVFNTPFGRPEVTVQYITKKAVSDSLVSFAMSRGFVIKECNDYNVTLAKKTDSFGAALLYGTNNEARLTFTLMEQNYSVRIIANIELISKANTAFEEHHQINNGTDARDVQDYLDGLKISLEN